jgi:hypothetical protein
MNKILINMYTKLLYYTVLLLSYIMQRHKKQVSSRDRTKRTVTVM